MARAKVFLYGLASGVVEPFAGVLGAALVLSMKPLLPYALAFASGAMIFVVGTVLSGAKFSKTLLFPDCK